MEPNSVRIVLSGTTDQDSCCARRRWRTSFLAKRGVLFEDLGANHFDRRDKDKVAKRLIRRLEELGLTVEVKTAS